jgi:orotate phosphoribosyltransferase-like protein
MKDQETKNKFVDLRAKGLSFDKISKQLNVSKPALLAWSRELSLEVANAKSLELDLLQEKYALSARQRLELHGQMLEKLKNEIGKRDITTLGTDKLYEMTLKVSAAIEKENLPVEFQKEETQTFADTFESLDGKKVVKSWEG